ncbi:uncharacterized protein BJX67DRAFT_276138 [Aspergillus lucknowensis]|uniref:Uncharacterized protein n=1 Tax=Aspergillus lucknowensis TaxID=176173 RepID=A0ABR4LEH3_9EURO
MEMALSLSAKDSRKSDCSSAQPHRQMLTVGENCKLQARIRQPCPSLRTVLYRVRTIARSRSSARRHEHPASGACSGNPSDRECLSPDLASCSAVASCTSLAGKSPTAPIQSGDEQSRHQTKCPCRIERGMAPGSLNAPSLAYIRPVVQGFVEAKTGLGDASQPPSLPASHGIIVDGRLCYSNEKAPSSRYVLIVSQTRRSFHRSEPYIRLKS